MDLSWSELLIVGIVALIVIGPKDLPGMFRELGRFTAKVRSMGREFSRAMEQAAKETGVKDVADDLKKVTSPKAMGLEAVKSAADKFEKWDPIKNAAVPTKPLTPPPMPAAMAAAEAAAAPATAAAAVPAAAPGPATAALFEQKAARKAVLDEAAEKLKAISKPEAAATAAPAAARSPGRRRKKPDSAGGDEA
jgi:sec-independent protein translocase protein TatB